MRHTFRYYAGHAVLLSAAVCAAFAPAFAQGDSSRDVAPKTGPTPIVGGFANVKPLPPGGPAPRMSDGHPDLTGRWYPNAGGKMLQAAYPVDRAVFQQFDPKATPEETPSYKPGVDSKYTRPNPYGVCDQPGTPSATLEQISQHAPMELIETPQRLVMLYEYPLNVRMIYMNRLHPKDPDPTFNGDYDRSLGRRYAGCRRDRHRYPAEESCSRRKRSRDGFPASRSTSSNALPAPRRTTSPTRSRSKTPWCSPSPGLRRRASGRWRKIPTTNGEKSSAPITRSRAKSRR